MTQSPLLNARDDADAVRTAARRLGSERLDKGTARRIL